MKEEERHTGGDEGVLWIMMISLIYFLFRLFQ